MSATPVTPPATGAPAGEESAGPAPRARLVDAALAAAGQGWRVFPLCPGRKLPRRQAADWEARATTDTARIERWWATHPLDNVGIATGPSRLVVVDLDLARPDDEPPAGWVGAAGGADVLARLSERYAQALPATWTVRTAGGGWHLYFATPDGPGLRNTQGRIGWKVDTRAAGGYVVAAGSRIGPATYSVTDDATPAPLPAWLGRLAAPPELPAPTVGPPAGREDGSPSGPPSSRQGYLDAALDAEVRRVLDAPAGTRNQALRKAAWSLGRFVAAGTLPRHRVEDALIAAGTASGYRDGPRAVAAVVASSINARLTRTPSTARPPGTAGRRPVGPGLEGGR